ncbi:hypothetical protein ACFQV4_12235 [Streptomyces thermocarboxydus]
MTEEVQSRLVRRKFAAVSLSEAVRTELTVLITGGARCSGCSTRSPGTAAAPSSSPTSPTASSARRGAVRRRRRAARLGAHRPPGRPQRGRRLDPRRTGRAGRALGPAGAVRVPGRHRDRAPPRRPGRRGARPAPHARRRRLLLGGAVRAEPAHRPGRRRRTGPPSAAPRPRRRTPVNRRTFVPLVVRGRRAALLDRTLRLLGLPGIAGELSATATAVLLSLARDQDAEVLTAHFAARLRAEPADEHVVVAAAAARTSFDDVPAGLREARHVADAVADDAAALDLPPWCGYGTSICGAWYGCCATIRRCSRSPNGNWPGCSATPARTSSPYCAPTWRPDATSPAPRSCTTCPGRRCTAAGGDTGAPRGGPGRLRTGRLAAHRTPRARRATTLKRATTCGNGGDTWDRPRMTR